MTIHSASPHWLARSIGSAAITPTLLLLAVGATLWGLGARGNATSASYAAVIALSLVLVTLVTTVPLGGDASGTMVTRVPNTRDSARARALAARTRKQILCMEAKLYRSVDGAV